MAANYTGTLYGPGYPGSVFDGVTEVTPDMVREDDRALPSGRNADGYRAKIPTSVSIFFQGRWRRVYATHYGNASHTWITVDGQQRHVDLYRD